MSRFFHILIFCLLPFVSLAMTDDALSSFNAGIKAYEQSQYEVAAHEFRASLKANETAAARHNLGLTQLQLGKSAEAAWQLERALIIEPFNRSYREKLNKVRQQLGLSGTVHSWYIYISRILTAYTWMLLGTVSFWVLLALLVFPLLSQRKVNSFIQWPRFFTFLLLATSLTAIWLNTLMFKSGIVISEEGTSLHAAPATAAPESGFARPGECVRIVDQYNNFYKVKTEESVTGWISKNSFRLLYEVDPGPSDSTL